LKILLKHTACNGEDCPDPVVKTDIMEVSDEGEEVRLIGSTLLQASEWQCIYSMLHLGSAAGGLIDAPNSLGIESEMLYEDEDLRKFFDLSLFGPDGAGFHILAPEALAENFMEELTANEDNNVVDE
jgi:hypothetical protein